MQDEPDTANCRPGTPHHWKGLGVSTEEAMQAMEEARMHISFDTGSTGGETHVEIWRHCIDGETYVVQVDDDGNPVVAYGPVDPDDAERVLHSGGEGEAPVDTYQLGDLLLSSHMYDVRKSVKLWRG
jgi:(2Fe-2S) ferredoxin